MDIIATRGGERKNFTKEVWDNMPADKYGWIVETEEPEEVRRLREAKEQPPQQIDPIYFALQGDTVTFDKKYLPELQHLGLDGQTAQTIASSIWGSLNEMSGRHQEELERQINTVTSLNQQLYAEQVKAIQLKEKLTASQDKVRELTGIIESIEQQKNTATSDEGQPGKVGDHDAAAEHQDAPAPPKKPTGAKK